MKGMVFTEFFEMVEQVWSLDMVDKIIADSAVPSGGAYTAVGNYPHEEMVALVVALSAASNIPAPDLIRTFGKHLFGRFVLGFPRFFEGISDTFHFLSGIETAIHAEVRKLYPDAELPSFEVHQSDNVLTMTYYSQRHFADLAEGLIAGCIEHYGEPITFVRETATDSPDAGARFVLTRGSPE